MDKLKPIGGTGGIIGVDKEGNIVMTFNTSGMFRGFVKSDGVMKVALFADGQ
jgi:beta-aspartyl-peptidase (threonine type)